MTRINTISPLDLLDQHLFAEWRELPRIFTLARYWADNGKRSAVPDSYRLGAGHVRFFYDKLQWLAYRHAILTSELQARGYKLGSYDEQSEYLTWLRAEHPDLWNDWEPSPADHRCNLQRLQSKLDAKPGFYKHFKAPAGYKHYEYRWMWWYWQPGHPKELNQQQQQQQQHEATAP